DVWLKPATRDRHLSEHGYVGRILEEKHVHGLTDRSAIDPVLWVDDLEQAPSLGNRPTELGGHGVAYRRRQHVLLRPEDVRVRSAVRKQINSEFVDRWPQPGKCATNSDQRFRACKREHETLEEGRSLTVQIRATQT